jgi:hypothetical protein
MQINSLFSVNGQEFADWFNAYQSQNRALFPHTLQKANFDNVMWDIERLTGKTSLSLPEWIGLFCFIYNETGGQFRSLMEVGGEAYYQAHGYNSKEKGRGLNQLTSASVYRVVLSELGYNYDAMSTEQLDGLFMKPNIYFNAFRIYLNSPQLAGNYFSLLGQQRFGDFGATIACGSPANACTAYRSLYESRCKALLGALQNQSIKMNLWNPNSRKALLIAAFLVFLFLCYLYRKEIWSNYKGLYLKVKLLFKSK